MKPKCATIQMKAIEKNFNAVRTANYTVIWGLCMKPYCDTIQKLLISTFIWYCLLCRTRPYASDGAMIGRDEDCDDDDYAVQGSYF